MPPPSPVRPTAPRWTDCLRTPPRPRPFLIGVLPGEGIGPEVVGCALDVLDAVAGSRVEIRTGGAIGCAAVADCGQALSLGVATFCEDVFSHGGVVFSGPGGGRYVYDMRTRFDLFFKISPLRAADGVPDASRFRPETLDGVDILVTRENTGGVYQGLSSEQTFALGRRVEHRFAYTEAHVRRFLDASARLAAQRRGRLTVVWKESGLPTLSGLWRECAEDAADAAGVRCQMVDIDLMSYRLIQEPTAFDVVAAPNLFGDVLADLGAVLLGSRGVSYSGNYTADGDAVYQTNHGAAYPLAGTDRANPCGQILSLAMMLRESFGLGDEADAVELAVRETWHDGWRTEDVAVPGCRVVGTREMGRRVAERAAQFLERGEGPMRIAA